MMGLGFLKGISSAPWYVYVILGAFLLNPVSYCKGRGDGKRVIIERLEKAEAKAEQKAKEAAESADAKAQERADDFETEQKALNDAIIEAEAYDSNPLDAIMGSGRD